MIASHVESAFITLACCDIWKPCFICKHRCRQMKADRCEAGVAASPAAFSGRAFSSLSERGSAPEKRSVLSRRRSDARRGDAARRGRGAPTLMRFLSSAARTRNEKAGSFSLSVNADRVPPNKGELSH